MPPNRRQRELARQKAVRQAERRAAQAKARQTRAVLGGVGILVIVVAILAVTLGGGGSSSSPVVAASGAPSATSSAAAGVACGGTDHPVATTAPSFSAPPQTTTARTYTMTMATSCGTITVALDGAKAPVTVNSLSFLAGQKYFDGTPCHRLVTSGIFVLQCGDPTGTGTGGPGYTIDTENLTGATYPAGTLAMANTGAAKSTGSQFFLCYKDTPLPASYTPVGKVTGGMDVLTQLASVGVTGGATDGAPAQKIFLDTVTIV